MKVKLELLLDGRGLGLHLFGQATEELSSRQDYLGHFASDSRSEMSWFVPC